MAVVRLDERRPSPDSLRLGRAAGLGHQWPSRGRGLTSTPISRRRARVKALISLNRQDRSAPTSRPRRSRHRRVSRCPRQHRRREDGRDVGRLVTVGVHHPVLGAAEHGEDGHRDGWSTPASSSASRRAPSSGDSSGSIDPPMSAHVLVSITRTRRMRPRSSRGMTAAGREGAGARGPLSPATDGCAARWAPARPYRAARPPPASTPVDDVGPGPMRPRQ